MPCSHNLYFGKALFFQRQSFTLLFYFGHVWFGERFSQKKKKKVYAAPVNPGKMALTTNSEDTLYIFMFCRRDGSPRGFEMFPFSPHVKYTMFEHGRYYVYTKKKNKYNDSYSYQQNKPFTRVLDIFGRSIYFYFLLFVLFFFLSVFRKPLSFLDLRKFIVYEGRKNGGKNAGKTYLNCTPVGQFI